MQNFANFGISFIFWSCKGKELRIMPKNKKAQGYQSMLAVLRYYFGAASILWQLLFQQVRIVLSPFW